MKKIKPKDKDKIEVPENPKAPAKRPEEVKFDIPKDLPKDGLIKVVDVNGHTLTMANMEDAIEYIKTSGGKIVI